MHLGFNTPFHIPNLFYRVYKPRISVYLSPEPSSASQPYMAQEKPTGTLPVYYGERMQDGTVIESPGVRPVAASDSRDALLRLPIQPNQAHLEPELMSPVSPVAPADALGINSGTPRTRSKAPGGDSSRWVTFPAGENVEDYPHRSRRYDRYTPSDYGGPASHRSAYVEEYEDDDRPRAYRRPPRRHSRPPLSHGRLPGPTGRFSHEQRRGSLDSHRISFDDYESDSPTKPRYHYYGSEEDEPRRPRTAYGDGGRRGPPRRPPPPDEVLRLPWTMWMNSNAKNRRFPPRLQSPRSRRKPKWQPQDSPLSLCLDGMDPSQPSSVPVLPAQLHARILILS